MSTEQIGVGSITHEVIIRVQGHETGIVVATVESLISTEATDESVVTVVHWGDMGACLRDLADKFERDNT